MLPSHALAHSLPTHTFRGESQKEKDSEKEQYNERECERVIGRARE